MASSEEATEQETATQRCASPTGEEGKQRCLEDAVGRFPIEIEFDGRTLRGEAWLCEGHRREGAENLSEGDA